MKALVKKLALGMLSARPIYPLLRARAFTGNPTTILCYHTLRPDSEPLDAWTVLGIDMFKAQLAMLRDTFDIVSLDDALLPSKSTRPRVVITFDDGERGLFDYILPLVKTENIPVTIYVATEQIETGSPYWFDMVMNALQAAGTTSIDLSKQGLGSWTVGPERGKPRWATIGSILEALKAVSPSQRDSIAADVIAQTQAQSQGFSPLQPLTLPQLKELATHPLVTIGAHSHGHELLDQLKLDTARASIVRSRELLSNWTGQSVRHFAYPNGNYTPELMELLDELEFSSGTILEDRLMRAGDSKQALPRIGVGRYDSLSRVKLRLVEV